MARTHGEVAQALPSCRALQSGSDPPGRYRQHPEGLAVAAAGRVHSQGSESNSGWCSVALPSSMPLSDVTWASGGTCSQTPSGGGPHPPLESVMTVVFAPTTCRPCKRCPVALSLHRRRFSAHGLHQRHPILQRLQEQRKLFLWWSALLLSSSPAMAPCFSCWPRPPPGSLSCGPPLPSPWHTTSLPRADLQSLSLQCPAPT